MSTLPVTLILNNNSHCFNLVTFIIVLVQHRQGKQSLHYLLLSNTILQNNGMSIIEKQIMRYEYEVRA